MDFLRCMRLIPSIAECSDSDSNGRAVVSAQAGTGIIEVCCDGASVRATAFTAGAEVWLR
jgi:hypothetical protein